jgi:putative colanic acid biosysnthesis UDP-glucose lipid carrier transferase
MVTIERVVAVEGGQVRTKYLNSGQRRAIDIVMASALLIVLAPILALVTIGIWLTSPGPILFRQNRNGKDMVPFEILKFRTMYFTVDPDPAVQQAQKGDVRITPLGKLLRSTSLDELPQLLNVIRGEMSLIGPRPHAVEHDAHYAELIPGYMGRFQVRPGLTGYAQVNGARGATPHTDDMKRRVDFDLLYIETASLSLDCQIFMRTIWEVLSSNSAY